MRLLKILPLLLIPGLAIATPLVKPYTFSAGQKIVSDQVNANFDAIGAIVNGQISTDNILDGGVATADLASNAVTGIKMADNTISTTKYQDLSVTGPKLADLSVTNAKLSISAIATAQIATAAITNIKIASGTITVDKLADGIPQTGVAVTCVAGNSSTDCVSLDVVPRGRPFSLGYVGLGSNTVSKITLVGTGGTPDAFVYIKRDGTTIYKQEFSEALGGSAADLTLVFPASIINTIDTPPAAINNTVRYTIGVTGSANTSITVSNGNFSVTEK